MYGLVFAVTLVFTMVSLNKDKEVYFKWFAGICWFVLALVNFISNAATGFLTIPVSFLWLGIGLVFSVWGIEGFFHTKKDKRMSFDEW